MNKDVWPRDADGKLVIPGMGALQIVAMNLGAIARQHQHDDCTLYLACSFLRDCLDGAMSTLVCGCEGVAQGAKKKPEKKAKSRVKTVYVNKFDPDLPEVVRIRGLACKIAVYAGCDSASTYGPQNAPVRFHIRDLAHEINAVANMEEPEESENGREYVKEVQPKLNRMRAIANSIKGALDPDKPGGDLANVLKARKWAHDIVDISRGVEPKVVAKKVPPGPADPPPGPPMVG